MPKKNSIVLRQAEGMDALGAGDLNQTDSAPVAIHWLVLGKQGQSPFTYRRGFTKLGYLFEDVSEGCPCHLIAYMAKEYWNWQSGEII